jgi:hypothetical protein
MPQLQARGVYRVDQHKHGKVWCDGGNHEFHDDSSKSNFMSCIQR